MAAAMFFPVCLLISVENVNSLCNMDALPRRIKDGSKYFGRIWLRWIFTLFISVAYNIYQFGYLHRFNESMVRFILGFFCDIQNNICMIWLVWDIRCNKFLSASYSGLTICISFCLHISLSQIRNSIPVQTGYGLDGWGIGFGSWQGGKFFSLPPSLDWLWGPPMGY
jgi:hypothetical protein